MGNAGGDRAALGSHAQDSSASRQAGLITRCVGFYCLHAASLALQVNGLSQALTARETQLAEQSALLKKVSGWLGLLRTPSRATLTSPAAAAGIAVAVTACSSRHVPSLRLTSGG